MVSNTSSVPKKYHFFYLVNNANLKYLNKIPHIVNKKLKKLVLKSTTQKCLVPEQKIFLFKGTFFGTEEI